MTVFERLKTVSHISRKAFDSTLYRRANKAPVKSKHLVGDEKLTKMEENFIKAVFGKGRGVKFPN